RAITQVHLSAFNGGAVGERGGLLSLRGGAKRFVLVFGDDACLKELFIALGLGAGIGKLLLIARQIGLKLAECRLERPAVQGETQLPLLDVLALGKVGT